MNPTNPKTATDEVEDVNKLTKWAMRKRRADVPLEDIETEGERQLKELAKKQIDTNVSLNEELNKRKEFTSASLFDPLSANVSGKYTLTEYQDMFKRDTKLEELRSFGLTEEEIKIKLSNNVHGKVSSESKYGTDPSVKKEVLEIIEDKIKNKSDSLQTSVGNTFQGAKKLSRHEMDLEKAITHDREKAKHLKVLVTGDEHHIDETSNDKIAIDLKQILNKLDGQSSHVDFDNCEIDNYPVIEKIILPSTGCEECDRLRQMDRYYVGPLLKTEYSYYEECDPCKQLRYHKIEEVKKQKEKIKNELAQLEKNKAIELSHAIQIQSEIIEDVPIEVIEKYRLTINQIKEIPKFSNYTPGVPSKVLYIKNLSNKVTVHDLKSVFNRFHDSTMTGEKIETKLLTGRMRGQAFVYFKDEQKAQEALEMVNGYDFKGKPMIIQFGKKG